MGKKNQQGNSSGPKRVVHYIRVSTDEQAQTGYSIPDQRRELREHEERIGYEVVAVKIDEGFSASSLNRPGWRSVEELVEAGRVDEVWATRRDRLFRNRRHRLNTAEAFKVHGTAIRAINDTGNRFGDAMLDEYAEYEREVFIERSMHGKLEKSRQGWVIPGRYAPYGYTYSNGRFQVDEARMVHVRRMFRMVGIENETMIAVRKAFDREGVPTPSDEAKYWSDTTIGRMLRSDVYLPRPYEEVAKLVGPEGAAQLDPSKRYSIYWFNGIAVPTPDPGIPPEWVKAARVRIEHNVRPPNAGHRHWDLKGLLFCPCGWRMTTHVKTRPKNPKHKPTFSYICNRRRKHGKNACEEAKYHNAARLEERVRRFTLTLAQNPDEMMEHVHKDIERERERLNSTDREVTGWQKELDDVERRRRGFVTMRADGDLNKEEYRGLVAELNARKDTAVRELERLKGATEHLKNLDTSADLVEEYIKELPYLIYGQESPIRDYTYSEEHEERKRKAREEGRLPVFPVTPEMFRERSAEEIEDLKRAEERKRGERYRALYDLLDLKVVARWDGTLDIVWNFGNRQMCLLKEEPTTTPWEATGEGLDKRLEKHLAEGGETNELSGCHKPRRRSSAGGPSSTLRRPLSRALS